MSEYVESMSDTDLAAAVSAALPCEKPGASTKEHEMTSRLNPYLNFAGNARAAMEFYRDVFGGSLTVNTFAEYSPPDVPYADMIMHAMLEVDNGFTLMGADNPPGTELLAGNNITVSLSGDDTTELHGYWDRLSEGGTVSVPLEKQMWGDEFGQCVDQFGIGWLVNISQPQS